MYSETIRAVLERARAELITLATAALSQGRFVELAEIARVSAALAAISPESHAPAADASGPALPVASLSAEKNSRGYKGPSKKSVSYPKFTRDADHLVKTAWSKKNREEYRHRTAVSTPHHLISAIERRGAGASFSPSEILPLYSGNAETPIPSYQAYLALAWLQYEGLIIKEGRDQYSLAHSDTSQAAIDSLLNALPASE